MKMLWPSDSSVRKQNVQDTWTSSGFCLTSLKIVIKNAECTTVEVTPLVFHGSGFHSNMTHTGCVSAVLSHFACIWGEMHSALQSL